MIPELAYRGDGYLKIYTRKGNKAYLALVRCNGETRFSRRVFCTASAADAYGDRLVARARRMERAQQAAPLQALQARREEVAA